MPDHYFERCTSPNAPALEGVEFIEIATSDPEEIGQLLSLLGFSAKARHRSKSVTLYSQGSINLLVNSTPLSFAADYAAHHGTAICALALTTPDVASAYQNLITRGAWDVSTSAGDMEMNIPAIESIGGTQIYLVDRYGDGINIYDIDFKAIPNADEDAGLLSHISGLTFAMSEERSTPWRDFLTQLLGFEPLGERTLRINGKTQLQLDDTAAPGIEHESISTLHFYTADLDKTSAYLTAQGLTLKPMGSDAIFELSTPGITPNIRFILSR